MSNSLLTTREAARFLRVSEASIRRWANAGLLAVSRVGRRRARRFREEDLLRFMGSEQGGPPPPTTGLPRAIAIQGMPVALGSHLAGFYSTEAGRLRVALPFLREGLMAGQPCLLYASPVVRDHYLRALRREKVDVDDTVRRGLLVLFPFRPASIEQWLATFERLVRDAARNHPGPVRVIGEPAAAKQAFKSVDALLALEQRLSVIVKRLPMVILCPYDAREFDGVAVLESLKLHFDTFSYQLGYFLH